eukprot:3655569-Prymnesium_polylepis.2
MRRERAAKPMSDVEMSWVLTRGRGAAGSPRRQKEGVASGWGRRAKAPATCALEWRCGGSWPLCAAGASYGRIGRVHVAS